MRTLFNHKLSLPLSSAFVIEPARFIDKIIKAKRHARKTRTNINLTSLGHFTH